MPRVDDFMDQWTANIKEFIKDYNSKSGINILDALTDEYGDEKVGELAGILHKLIFPIIVLQFHTMFVGIEYAPLLHRIAEVNEEFLSMIHTNN